MATKNEGKKNINLGHGVGRRKTSVARVYLRDGNGKVTINGKDIAVYFVDAINAAKVVQPFEVTETQGKYDLVITVAGGGICSQAEACRHGLARALVNYDENYRHALQEAGFMTQEWSRERSMARRAQEGASSSPRDKELLIAVWDCRNGSPFYLPRASARIGV